MVKEVVEPPQAAPTEPSPKPKPKAKGKAKAEPLQPTPEGKAEVKKVLPRLKRPAGQPKVSNPEYYKNNNSFGIKIDGSQKICVHPPVFGKVFHMMTKWLSKLLTVAIGLRSVASCIPRRNRVRLQPFACKCLQIPGRLSL